MEDLLSETTDFDSSETSTLVLSGSDAGHFQIDFPSSALSSGSTAVDSQFHLRRDSAAPSNISSLTVVLTQPYDLLQRRLLMAKIKEKYKVLFPFWVCECAVVPRDSEKKPHPSQYYPLHCQQQEWKEWQEKNLHEIDPGGQISLNAIDWHSENPDEPPPFHLWYLIMAAINGSPMKRLTENEIKLALIRRFRYFSYKQHNSVDHVDEWIVNVSNELRENNLFSESDVFKQDQDDFNCYWCLTMFPHDNILFHPRTQCLDSRSQAQDAQNYILSEPAKAPSISNDTRPFRKYTNIPIHMLVHPGDFNPLCHENIEITARNIDTWTWLPS